MLAPANSKQQQVYRMRTNANRLIKMIGLWLFCSPGLPLQANGDAHHQLAIVDTRQMVDVAALLDTNDNARVFYVGETHDRQDHHDVQLALVAALHQREKKVGIGVEWFQRPFQPVLDKFLRGEISEAAMLSQTHYFSRWRYDYRLYRPILLYARDNQIPIYALNASAELIDAVGEFGIDNLPEELQAQRPDTYDLDDTRYKQRLKQVYDQHPRSGGKFEDFYLTQLTWDESMAQAVAEALQRDSNLTMVVMAGSGHIEYGSGIPSRVKRRVDVPQVSILITDDNVGDPIGRSDYLVMSTPRRYPAAGLLGAYLDTDTPHSGKGVQVTGFGSPSALKDAGVATGARILSIDGQPVNSYAELKLVMLERKAGDEVELTYQPTENEQEKKLTLVLN